MPNLKTAVPFKGTKEQENLLRVAIQNHKGQPGAIMPIMQEAQGIYGYLPEEVLVIIAQEMNMPLSDLYGIASFYSQFTLNPKGKYQISICLGTVCYVRGAGNVLKALETPIRQIAFNAGIEGSVIVDKIISSGKANYGFDAYKEEYTDMIDAGIVDPTKVTRSALENAASVASMVLTTESLVADKKEDAAAANAAAAAAAASAGGMY